jgi:hypothetical protein
MMHGEPDRLRRHLFAMRTSPETVRKLPRSYWRRKCCYVCPEPERIIRGLYDVYSFFREMEVRLPRPCRRKASPP